MVLVCFPRPQNGAPNPAALNSRSFTTFFSFPFPSLLFLSFPSFLSLIPPKSPWNRASHIPLAQHEKPKAKRLLWFLQGYTIKNSLLFSVSFNKYSLITYYVLDSKHDIEESFPYIHFYKGKIEKINKMNK